MYDSLRSVKFISIILIVLGIIFFLLELAAARSVSLIGLILFLIGFGLNSLMRAVRTELEKLRLEIAELRRQTKEKWK
ncbi:hypothetical protein A8990_104197 [Paenibacillus taihuensis]|uniref:Uncharacterized protein n=1 Tax=Paenibacillus taihuensis TaxID=1156355 RepID=A0A3D9SM71_9BACL|nr:hypothetical protein [Paenibacillus taihuensis]REE91689.1 hypothetical protein A8990_104197 [Paenibacillus taihuensis]